MNLIPPTATKQCIEIWTDGSVDNNTQQLPNYTKSMGCSAVILNPITSQIMQQCQARIIGSAKSVRPEFFAVLMAIQECPANSDIKIYTDSQAFINLAKKLQRELPTQRQTTKLPNNNLIDYFVHLLKQRQGLLFFHKVKGHSGIPLNTLADKLANEARKLPSLTDIPATNESHSNTYLYHNNNRIPDDARWTLKRIAQMKYQKLMKTGE